MIADEHDGSAFSGEGSRGAKTDDSSPDYDCVGRPGHG